VPNTNSFIIITKLFNKLKMYKVYANTIQYTMTDAECDKPSMDVDRARLTLATVDELWPNFYKSQFGTTFQIEMALILVVIPKFRLNTVYDKPIYEYLRVKTISVRSAVSIQLRLVA